MENRHRGDRLAEDTFTRYIKRHMNRRRNMEYNLPKRVENEIRFFAQKYCIERIVLFGSRARGTNYERSDIDLAISGGDFDAFYWDVKEKVHSLLTFDIVDMDSGISDELAEEIERDGVILYEKA